MNFREQITVFKQNELSDQANRQHLIDTAQAKLAEVQESGQASINYTTAIDGHRGNAEDAKQQIVYTFEFVAEAAVFALSYLQNRVQKDTGTTSESFWISVNGNFMMATEFDPASVPIDSEIVIGNTVAWFRRLDVNLVGSRQLKFLYPGDLDDCVRATKRQFSGIVTAKRVSDYGFPDKYKPVHSGYTFQSPAIIINSIT